jgi:hypothetical protein
MDAFSANATAAIQWATADGKEIEFFNLLREGATVKADIEEDESGNRCSKFTATDIEDDARKETYTLTKMKGEGPTQAMVSWFENIQKFITIAAGFGLKP